MLSKLFLLGIIIVSDIFACSLAVERPLADKQGSVWFFASAVLWPLQRRSKSCELRTTFSVWATVSNIRLSSHTQAPVLTDD